MSSDNNKLPRGWISTSLGEITEVSKDKISPDELPGVPYIGLEHIQRDAGKLIGHGTSDEVKSTKSRFQEGDVLYGKLRPYLNKVCIPDFDGVCSTDLLVFKQTDCIDSRYLQYTLLNKDFVSYANSNVSGVQHPRTNEKTIARYPFLLPPLPEQHRIVNKIEELFTQLDAGVDLLQKTKVLLNQYRQSVLKAAFEGKLTEDWRKKTRTDDWELVTIEDLSRKITDGEHLRPKIQDKGIPFLSAKNVRDNGVDFEDALFVSNSDAEKFRKRCDPEREDLLIVSRGATVGRSCIVGTDQQFCLLGSVILIKPHSQITPKFFSYALKSPQIKKGLIGLSGSTAQQAIYLRDIKNLKIPLPSLKEQDLIVNLLEGYISSKENTELEVAKVFNFCSSLRRSTLNKAFQGKLVPQDPSDEPASKLLERIKTERSGDAPRGRKPRQTKMF
jgi:type I restriction enzyme, S subunit